MTRIVIAVCAAIGVLLSSAANAGDARLTWVNATQRVDGSSLTASSLRGTKIEWSRCQSQDPATAPVFGAVAGQFTVAAGLTTHSITGLPSGRWCFRAYTLAVDTDGVTQQESDPSSVVAKVIMDAKPAPPSLLTVQELVVYNVLKQRDRFVLLPVGTVPADTACDATNEVNGYYAVPRAAVTWYGSSRSEVVVARCG